MFLKIHCDERRFCPTQTLGADMFWEMFDTELEAKPDAWHYPDRRGGDCAPVIDRPVLSQVTSSLKSSSQPDAARLLSFTTHVQSVSSQLSVAVSPLEERS